MLIVGLTGGIACGKSTVSSRLRSRHALPIVDLDELARSVVDRLAVVAHRRIVKRFGDAILFADGTIDREALGALIFADRESRRALNKATHLPILWELLCDLDAAQSAGASMVILDAPLLFESGLHLLCGTTVVVRASDRTQRERLQSRDGRTAEDAEQRIASQMPVAAKAARAQHVIDNEASLEATHQQVDALVVNLAGLSGGILRGLLLHVLLLGVRLAGWLMGGGAERKRRVLIVGDMQKDYDIAANMKLYGEVRSPYANKIGGIVPAINQLRSSERWANVIFTLDWLPATMNRTFCLADSPGAALLDELDVDPE